jgi:hypothetical protein
LNKIKTILSGYKERKTTEKLNLNEMQRAEKSNKVSKILLIILISVGHYLYTSVNIALNDTHCVL